MGVLQMWIVDDLEDQGVGGACSAKWDQVELKEGNELALSSGHELERSGTNIPETQVHICNDMESASHSISSGVTGLDELGWAHEMPG